MSGENQYPASIDSAALGKASHLLDHLQKVIDYLCEHPEANAEHAAIKVTGFRGKGLLETFQTIVTAAMKDPDVLARHYGNFATLALRALAGEAELTPAKGDRRFKDEMWQTHPFYRGLLQIYLAWSQSVQAWVDEQPLHHDDRQRVQFLLDQVVNAITPSNLPIHPGALKRAEKTNGESFVTGVRHWIDDVLHNGSMPRQILPGAYTLGRDLATTPGAVVLRNHQLELIQYRPLTERVYQRPVLLIPPQINKFYAFDLRPSNSMIRYLLEQGLQVFTISWWNPTEQERDWGLDVYVAAVLRAMDAARQITGSASINLMSACAGGLTAVALLGYLAEKQRKLVHSHSLFVTALLPTEGSVLDRFATPEAYEHARQWVQRNGVMDGKQLAKIFTWLRPNELVWSYWVNNYLMGRKPHALDVLYWDNDSTHLPARLHADFLDMYGYEMFQHPRRLKLLGRRIDFRKVRVDTYFTAGLEDYLTPWEGVYRAAKLFRGRHEFLLSDSGHVQSILRPINLTRVEYFTNTALPGSAQEWKETAVRHEGSWWPHWAAWLKRKSGRRKCAPAQLGSRRFPELMAAPGSYVYRRS